MKKIIFLSILLTLQTLLFSQNPSEDFLGSWYTYGSSHRISENFSITPYGELRFYEPSSNYNLVIGSIAGNYHFSSKSSIGIGYAYLDIDTVFEFDKVPNLHENRLFEQYVYKHNWGKIKVSHRGRLEQRFLDFKTRNETQHRFRYKLSLKYNLNRTFYFVMSDEPFVNFQDQAFHENRFYTGIGINILENSQIQVGYLKQHITKNNLNRIQIGISFQTDSRKPKTTLTQL
ncbi:DUF2490 domain-containing protein [uncultured Winogradskyella sp.]|uniref:DUF2490 domain-containing protein n=1 Tax=uncultured Winogradskyella sp. TaxID=395353 RepID=UPI00262E6C53|nr:DUF2490 domain-containing protein [uncultured Winogradskyella sp.]